MDMFGRVRNDEGFRTPRTWPVLNRENGVLTMISEMGIRLSGGRMI